MTTLVTTYRSRPEEVKRALEQWVAYHMYRAAQQRYQYWLAFMAFIMKDVDPNVPE